MRISLKKTVTAAMLAALTVALSGFYIPIGVSKCYPIQHMVNVLCAVFLGPGYGVMAAFCTSLIRNLMGTGSLLAFPGSMVGALLCGINVLCAVFLGPGYGVMAAFCTSLIRNLMGTGSLLAFPGSMVGALLCGILYEKTGKLLPTYLGEVIGTGILGGMLCYPVAVVLMGKEAALFTYVMPFLMSTCC